MNNLKRVIMTLAPVMAGVFVFTSFLLINRAPVEAAGAPDLKAIPPRQVTPTVSITDTVIARVSALLTPTGHAPALARFPDGASLASVSVDAEVVTVVLSLPDSVLYDPNVAIDSDGMNMAVIQSLDDMPLRVFHVLALDPRDPAAGPKGLSAFIRLRPVTTKPVDDGAVTAQPQSPQQKQSLAPAATYALSGKSVYLSAGHGWYYNPSYGWVTQRGVYQGVVEDLNNAEAVNQYLVAYLRQAGADVNPAREPSLNTSQVIVRNTGPGYAESGSWTASSLPGTGYQGDTYRYALTTNSAPSTASATWTANIPVSGWYPVYAWYVAGGNRVPDARYVIEYPLGTHVTTIDQTKHGNTWRYLGTFYFRAGQTARVRLLNTSSIAGVAVIADAVRFGGGLGDYNSGGGVSNKPRWEEAARYFTYMMGAPTSVYDSYPGNITCDYSSPDLCDDITARPRYADWENTGTGDDAILVSWHTNGWDGSKRGTSSYVYNNDPTPPYDQYHLVPGSTNLQAAIHSRVIQAIRAAWDPSWVDGGMQQANLGEVRVAQTMPSMLIELGYHDNVNDAAAMRDPRFEQLEARAMYQGIVNYYAQKAGITPHYVPEPPVRFSMRNAGNGTITLAWQAPPTTAYGTSTDPATGYRIYLSDDGSAWDEGRDVGALSLSLSGYSSNQLVYARVTAVSPGGESFPSPVLALRVGTSPRSLIVHAFDSIDASMDINQTMGGVNFSRILVDRMNRLNYIAQHAKAIPEPFDSAVHQAVGAGDVGLANYRFVDWYSGRQSEGDISINTSERQALSNWAAGSNRVLLVNGANVAVQLYHSDQSFLSNVLHSGFVMDNANAYAVNTAGGGLFNGLGSFNLDNGTQGTYNAQSNDVLNATNGSTVDLTYNTGAPAATVYRNASGTSVITLGFPFETIYPASAQNSLVQRAMSLLPAYLSISSSSYVPIGTQAVFSASLVGNYSYAWNFGDGSPIVNVTTVAVTHLYAAQGTYTVWLTATNNVDHSVSGAQKTIVVSGPITPRLYLPVVMQNPAWTVEARAVWISRFDWCSPAPCSRTRLENLINHAADAHFNIVLFQVRGTADAFYTPGLEPWSYLLTSAQTSTLGTSPGWDPLAVAIQLAHSRGMQLHAYVNMYSTWECGKGFPPHTTPEHPFWSLGNYVANPYSYSSTWRVYSTTASGPTAMSVLTSAPVPCSEYLWSSPGVNRVGQESLNVVKDIVSRYDVDGIHMDRVRYPGPQYSTDPESLAAWQPVSASMSYQDWERDMLSKWVMRVYTEVKAIKPAVKVSAAVWFTYKKTDAITFPTSQGFYDYLQDSHRWITEGSLDAMAPMIYGATFNSDITKWQQLANDHIAVQGGRQVWLGIGGAIVPFNGINDRIDYARSIGAKGVALWSAGALEMNNYWGELANGPFKDVAVAP